MLFKEMASRLLIFMCACQMISMVGCTNDTTVNNTDTSTPAPSTSTAVTNSCVLVPELPTAGDVISELANSGKQLVRITVTTKGQSGSDIDYETHLKHWVISTSLTGQSMLMLKEYFDEMSLYTLGLGVESFSVTLDQNPNNCLQSKRTEDIENILRSHFLHNFGSTGQTLPAAAEICNTDIGEVGANKDCLVYFCCKYDQENNLQCSELIKGVWIQLLFASIIVVQVLIILYSPVYMPGFMYKAKSIFQKFVFTPEPDKLLQLRVKVVTDPSNIDHGFSKAELQEFSHLDKFKMHVENLKRDEVHSLLVKGIDLCVRDSKIIAEGNAPVTLFSFIKDFFIRCKLRYDIISVRDCCLQDMWVKLPCKLVFRWYQCLSGIMMLITLVILSSPWLLRVWFYYAVEKEKLDYQKQLYEKNNLKMPYPGNLVAYLSPIHPLFLVIYIVFGVEILSYMILPRTAKEKVKFTVRKCFRDTRDKSKLEACGKLAAYGLRPLKTYGIVGCLLLPLWVIILPLYFLAIAIEVIPILNLSVRLLVNLIFYISKVINPNTFRRNSQQQPGKFSTWMQNRFDTIIVKNENEADTRWNKLLHTLALIMTFVTIWLFLILVVECISFFVECAVYAFVGFILNPTSILKYLTIALLIGVYGADCFNGVHNRYAAYCTGISGEVQDMIGDKMTEEAAKSNEEQKNTAFRVPAKNYVPDRMCFTTGPDGFLKWNASRLVLFLDKTDVPYIPTSFLFRMGQLNHFLCPGLVHLLYLRAFLDFSIILLFLAFVFIVIFAFGQADDISSLGQAVLALGYGFFPLILKRFLFKSQTYTLDRSNLHWKTMFANAVQKYSEKWNFEDIIIAKADQPEKMEAEEEKPAADTTDVALIETTKTNGMEMKPVTDLCKVNDMLEVEIDANGCTSPCEAADLIVHLGAGLEDGASMTFYVPPECCEKDSTYTAYTAYTEDDDPFS